MPAAALGAGIKTHLRHKVKSDASTSTSAHRTRTHVTSAPRASTRKGLISASALLDILEMAARATRLVPTASAWWKKSATTETPFRVTAALRCAASREVSLVLRRAIRHLTCARALLACTRFPLSTPRSTHRARTNAQQRPAGVSGHAIQSTATACALASHSVSRAGQQSSSPPLAAPPLSKSQLRVEGRPFWRVARQFEYRPEQWTRTLLSRSMPTPSTRPPRTLLHQKSRVSLPCRTLSFSLLRVRSSTLLLRCRFPSHPQMI